MLKKYLMITLSCSFMAGTLRTEEVPQSYVKQLWHAFTKKVKNIARYVDNDDIRPYAGTFVISSLTSTIMGVKLWLERNEMVKNFVYDSNGNMISNNAELFEWFEKIKNSGKNLASIVYKTDKWKFTNDTGESFTHIFETKLEPITSDFGYKLMVGTAGVIALAAIYSAYKLLTITPKKTEITPEDTIS